MRKIRADIERLEMLAENSSGTLSEGNKRYYDELKHLERFAGQDQWIAIAPRGAITLTGDVPTGHIKCVPAHVAALQLAFSDVSGQRIRLATASEIDAQKAYESARTMHERQTIANRQAELARQAMTAFLGAGIPGGSTPGASQPAEVPTPPVAQFGSQQSEDFEVQIPEVPEAPAETASPGALDALGTPAQVARLTEAGVASVEEVAGASPEALAKRAGIGKAVAAQMIAAASEAVAAKQ